MADDALKVIIKSDLSAWRDANEALVRRAAFRAGSDALSAARAEAVRQVRERRRVSATAVRKAIYLRYPPNAPDAKPVWVLGVKRIPMPVLAYDARQTKAGVTAAIKPGGRSLIRGAFIATMKSGHRGVFRRTGEIVWKPGKRGRDIKREKIKELFTTTVFNVFTDEGFVEAVAEKAHAVFERAFTRNLQAK